MPEVRLTAPQFEALTSSAPRVLFLAGIGSGKTTCLAYTLITKLAVPGVVCGVFAPSRKVVAKAVLRTIKTVWSNLGIVEGRDYVVNRRSPWKPFTLGNNNGILSTRWGSYVIFDGLENYDSQRGQEYDCVFIDEFRDVRPDALAVLEGRLRGQTYRRLGLPHQLFVYTTVPDDVTVVTRHFSNAHIITASTYSNAHNLPPNYIPHLQQNMSDLQFRREVLAELVPATNNLFAYAFSADRHVRDADLGEGELWISFDFNVAPAVATLWEVTTDSAYCFDEVVINNVSIYEFCTYLLAMRDDWADFYVTGDASGMNRSGQSRNLETYYHIIRHELGIPRGHFVVPSRNPLQRDSYALVNAVLERKTVAISPRCSGLITDLMSVLYDPVSGIDKSVASRGHLLDTLRYLFHLNFTAKHDRL